MIDPLQEIERDASKAAPWILSAKNLTKTVGGRALVEDVSFDVRQGEVFGLLGSNGAGKTTIIRMLTGLMRPTAGNVTIMGRDIRREFARAITHVGAIVESPDSFRFLTGMQNLQQVIRLSGKDIPDGHVRWCVKTVDLESRIDDKVSTYSLGMRQRLGIARALVTQPKLLILDEPTNGMDPAGIRDMRTLVDRLARSEGLSILMSTHLLVEAEVLCDRVGVVVKGKMITVQDLENLRTTLERMEFELFVDRKDLHRAEMLMREKDVEVNIAYDRLIIECRSLEVADMAVYLAQAGIPVIQYRPRGSSLEQFFMSETGGERT